MRRFFICSDKSDSLFTNSIKCVIYVYTYICIYKITGLWLLVMITLKDESFCYRKRLLLIPKYMHIQLICSLAMKHPDKMLFSCVFFIKVHRLQTLAGGWHFLLAFLISVLL